LSTFIDQKLPSLAVYRKYSKSMALPVAINPPFQARDARQYSATWASLTEGAFGGMRYTRGSRRE
jgi:hypothetical protein